MQFKVALFDLDGTVLDTEPQYTSFWGRVGREYHPEMTDFAQRIKGTTLKQILDSYFPDTDIQQTIVTQLDEWESQMKYPFVAGVEDFIRDLKKHGVKTAVVTSSNQKKMRNVQSNVPQFSSLFDKVLTAEMFAASKPDPDCYLRGADAFRADKSDCVVFEDAFTGLQAGMRSGMLTLGVATTNTVESIRPCCHHAYEDFTGLNFKVVSDLLVRYWDGKSE